MESIRCAGRQGKGCKRSSRYDFIAASSVTHRPDTNQQLQLFLDVFLETPRCDLMRRGVCFPPSAPIASKHKEAVWDREEKEMRMRGNEAPALTGREGGWVLDPSCHLSRPQPLCTSQFHFFMMNQ